MVTIRRATTDDASRISALLTSLAEEFIVRDFTAEGRKRLLSLFSVAQVAARLSSAEYRFHVAEDDAALAGVVAMRGSSHLYHLFTAKPYQRTGLARRMFEIASDDARRDASTPSRITVNASSYAIGAYERLGFRCAGPMRETDGVRFQPMAKGEDQ